MKKKILFVAVAIALALAFVLPSFGAMSSGCPGGCPAGMVCQGDRCVEIDG